MGDKYSNPLLGNMVSFALLPSSILVAQIFVVIGAVCGDGVTHYRTSFSGS